MGIFGSYGKALSSAYRNLIDSGRALGLCELDVFALPPAGYSDSVMQVHDLPYKSGSVVPGPVNCGKNDVKLMKTGTHGNGVHERHELKLSKKAEQKRIPYRGGCHSGGDA
jgi:hypothetical protein